MKNKFPRRFDRFSDRNPGAGHCGAFSEFGRIIVQDGSSFAVKEVLREHYSGRFKSKEPAAVDPHVTMDLPHESLSSVVPTPDTFAERSCLRLSSSQATFCSPIVGISTSRTWV